MFAMNNDAINYGIGVVILSAIFLIVGLIKPKWVFFWLTEPNRFAVMVASTLLFMIGMTLFGEGNRQKRIAEQALHPQAKTIQAVPVVTPPAPPPVATGLSSTNNVSP